MRYLSLLAVPLLLLVGCYDQTTESTTDNNPPAGRHQPGVADAADQIRPVGEGAIAPSARMKNVDGRDVVMTTVYQRKPTVLVFYRGGWCPYCNTHLEELATHADQLREMGFQIVGISPDRPSELAKSIDKLDLDYTLLSDADAELTRAFGLAFKVGQPTIEQYKGYGIDLEASSGYDHHILPVPAVYLIDTAGRIRFAFWDADYKNRLSGQKLLAVARKMTR